ncbi:hypothetical protein K445DRAFT_9855 [Daldinia sp. EC12]|nr:hypothetical protein K445DRAFT_9855 [Daldinia sp. EC12]
MGELKRTNTRLKTSITSIIMRRPSVPRALQLVTIRRVASNMGQKYYLFNNRISKTGTTGPTKLQYKPPPKSQQGLLWAGLKSRNICCCCCGRPEAQVPYIWPEQRWQRETTAPKGGKTRGMNQGNGVRQHTTPPSDKTVSRKLKESPGSIECSSSGSSEKRLRIENEEDSDDNKQEEDETRLISRMLPNSTRLRASRAQRYYRRKSSRRSL